VKASRTTALVYVEKWVEWLDDGRPPAFGLMGMMRPKDDPPPGMWAVIQVECALPNQKTYDAVYGLHVLKLSYRVVAAKLNEPKSSLHDWHRRWLQMLADQIENRPAETVVEAEIRKWRAGERDAICDMAANCAKIWLNPVRVQTKKNRVIYAVV